MSIIYVSSTCYEFWTVVQLMPCIRIYMRHRLNTMFCFKLADDLNSNLIETKLPKQIPDDLFF